MRVYIAGPMTGLPRFNADAFHAAASKLRHHKHDVVNPAELDWPDQNQSWQTYMKRDIALLVTCEAIYLLNGWMESRGAGLERHIAMVLDIAVFYEGVGDSPLMS